MKITRITAYRIDLPLHEGSYKWSGGHSVKVFDSTIVSIETDAGITGYGEVCPLGPAYLPALLVEYASRNRPGCRDGRSVKENLVVRLSSHADRLAPECRAASTTVPCPGC